MRITRFPSLDELQLFGCVSAFVDTLQGELNAAAAALKKLEGKAKGSAFAFEMTLDAHRYGALIVLDRWGTFTAAFAPHLHLSHDPEILNEAKVRIESAETVLHNSNQLIDAAERYTPEVVEVCLLVYQSLKTTFRQEIAAADQMLKLGPMLAESYKEARRIFLEDLAAR